MAWLHHRFRRRTDISFPHVFFSAFAVFSVCPTELLWLILLYVMGLAVRVREGWKGSVGRGDGLEGLFFLSMLCWAILTMVAI